jgi:predicted solute-binding protein
MVKNTTKPTTIYRKQTMTKISAEVAEKTGLPETFAAYYWRFFQNVYCLGCEKAGVKEAVL